MGQVIFYTIVFYLLYKFLTGFLIPVIRAYSQMKSNIDQVKEQMKGKNEDSFNNEGNVKKPSSEKPPKHDYIDFEEIKD